MNQKDSEYRRGLRDGRRALTTMLLCFMPVAGAITYAVIVVCMYTWELMPCIP